MRGILIGLIMVGFFLSLDAEGEVPETIRDCRTDVQCEVAAQHLCDDGHIKWCIREA